MRQIRGCSATVRRELKTSRHTAINSPSPRGRGPGTAIELSIGTPSVGRPLPARNERGEGWGEGKSDKNATPLPGPLLLLRRKRGRRARSIPLIQCQCTPALSPRRGGIVRCAFANPERLDSAQRGMRCPLSLREGQGEGERDVHRGDPEI